MYSSEVTLSLKGKALLGIKSFISILKQDHLDYAWDRRRLNLEIARLRSVECTTHIKVHHSTPIIHHPLRSLRNLSHLRVPKP